MNLNSFLSLSLGQRGDPEKFGVIQEDMTIWEMACPSFTHPVGNSLFFFHLLLRVFLDHPGNFRVSVSVSSGDSAWHSFIHCLIISRSRNIAQWHHASFESVWLVYPWSDWLSKLMYWVINLLLQMHFLCRIPYPWMLRMLYSMTLHAVSNCPHPVFDVHFLNFCAILD